MMSVRHLGKNYYFIMSTSIYKGKTNYALVGANGAGKSTFFNLITGELGPSDGQIDIPKDASIGWLRQDQYKYDNVALIDVVIQGKTALWDALQEKEQLLSAEEWTEELGFRLGDLEEINQSSGWLLCRAKSRALTHRAGY